MTLPGEIVMPAVLFVAFVEDEVCPLCLGWLRLSEVCPECGADLGPALDAIEEMSKDEQ